MASAEHLLISKVLADGSLSEAIAQGVQSVHFSSPNQPIWAWMLEFWQKHGSVPTQRVMQSEHPSVTVGDASGETLSRLVDEVIEGHRSTTVTGLMTEALVSLKDGNTEGAIRHLTSGLQDVSAVTSQSKDVDLISEWENRLVKYADMRERPDELIGLSTGFPGLDRLTAGIRPQQLITFVGEA